MEELSLESEAQLSGLRLLANKLFSSSASSFSEIHMASPAHVVMKYGWKRNEMK